LGAQKEAPGPLPVQAKQARDGCSRINSMDRSTRTTRISCESVTNKDHQAHINEPSREKDTDLLDFVTTQTCNLSWIAAIG